MKERPTLEQLSSGEEFKKYYYLKEELIAFCRKNKLQTTGGKMELNQRIIHYLDYGERLTSILSKSVLREDGAITLDMKIGPNFVCSEKHRSFYKEQLGKGFSFLVPFQKWLKSNPDKTYQESLLAYEKIMSDKKNHRHKIDPQFEYNTYIRDFFSDNPNLKLDSAIQCWKYKKSLPGSHKYSREDLTVLSEKRED